MSNVEYNYIYEDGKLIRATESTIMLDGEMVISKTLVSTTLYSYNSEGAIVKKRIIFAGGDEHTVFYENKENENAVVKFTAGGKNVLSHSKSDSFGRKSFDELQLSSGTVSRRFTYHDGVATDTHIEHDKLKSGAVTQLVKTILFSNGRTIDYEYDEEERITKVIDSADGTTEYTYDALGQLILEMRDGTSVNLITYDNYGNIRSKNGITYVYGNTVWKDLLTSYNGQSITYDAQGNPLSYLGHTLTWEKGRQLKSFDSNTYTYNANGIRTSKTINGVKHTYALDGTKIVKEEWGTIDWSLPNIEVDPIVRYIVVGAIVFMIVIPLLPVPAIV